MLIGGFIGLVIISSLKGQVFIKALVAYCLALNYLTRTLVFIVCNLLHLRILLTSSPYITFFQLKGRKTQNLTFVYC